MKRLLMCTFLMFTLVVSCGGKKDIKRESADSKIAKEAFALAETLREAYQKKDTSAIEKSTTRDGFRAVAGVMRPFDTARLSFNPVWVEIDGGTVQMNVQWSGHWLKGDRLAEERGMAVFVLQGRPLKLDKILRANPFKYPE
ncbi:MAG: hypothetical protein K8I29_15870 [Alphaproteobacteria bacterium]|uniref:Lipoprotein n=1 Tax=Candidatus Nitrobium versatile TaxID=2884831 RepID=A0A953J8F9_9BACT|nr:hypothetical protein [Candidatus Nitrobium versatile]